MTVVSTSSTATVELLPTGAHVPDFSGSVSKRAIASIRALAILLVELAFNGFKVISEISPVGLWVSVVIPIPTVGSLVFGIKTTWISTLILLIVATEVVGA